MTKAAATPEQWERCYQRTVGRWCHHADHKQQPNGSWLGLVPVLETKEK